MPRLRRLVIRRCDNNAGAGHFDAAGFFPWKQLRASFKFWFSAKSN